jgi:HEAT repeat protein
VRQAREDPASGSSLQALRDVLRSREARAVARAAAVAAEQDLQALRPDLVAALKHLLDAKAKADPGCAAKAALAEALDRLGHGDPDLFVRAIRHVQWEPVWGGRVDTATDLRGAAAMALVRLDPPDALQELARLLADPEPPARMSAARALAYRGTPDGLPLLHLRIHMGDPVPAVLGACFEAVLRVAPASCVPFVAEFLDAPAAEVAEEAALALGGSRRVEAFAPLRDWCARTVDPARRPAALRALVLLRREEALDVLLERVRAGSAAAAGEAVLALGILREDPALAERVRAAAADRGEAEVRSALKKAFP